jgi:hypothetical protein
MGLEGTAAVTVVPLCAVGVTAILVRRVGVGAVLAPSARAPSRTPRAGQTGSTWFGSVGPLRPGRAAQLCALTCV